MKPEKSVAHKIGYCISCGWVHGWVGRVRVEEITENGKIAVIKSLCKKCQDEFRHQVVCNLCGRTEGDNLYPVSVERKRFDDIHSCNLFLHLCFKCRQLPHAEVLKRLSAPNMCDTCSDRFLCYTGKNDKTAGSYVAPDKNKFFKNAAGKLRRMYGGF